MRAPTFWKGTRSAGVVIIMLKAELGVTVQSCMPFKKATEMTLKLRWWSCRMAVSAKGVLERDELVFGAAFDAQVPICMLLSGGYAKRNARVIADSLKNLFIKFDLAHRHIGNREHSSKAPEFKHVKPSARLSTLPGFCWVECIN